MNINTSAKSNKILGLKVDGRRAALQMKALRVVTHSAPAQTMGRAARLAEEGVSAFKQMLPKFPRL